jgi:integrase
VLEFQVSAGRSVNTQRASTYHAEHLLLLGQHKPLSEITLADTTGYLRRRLELGASRHTIKKELGTLTQAIRRCAKLGIYVPVVDPEHLIPDELGKAYEPRTRWLTREQYEKLVNVLRPAPLAERNQRVQESARVRAPAVNRADYVIAWCNLGLRKSELFDVQPEDYNPTRQELHVRGTKTDKADRLVPVNKIAAEVLGRRCALETPFPEWHGSNCTRDLAKACKLLGMAPVTPNDFRRTFCSWLCQAGVPERVCAELMGHGSTVMVRAVYGQLDMASMRRAVAQL